MRGKGKNDFGFLVACQLYAYGTMSIEDTINNGEQDEGGGLSVKDTIADLAPGAEQTLIKKELVENLSEEARSVMQLILEAPVDVLRLLKTPRYDKVSRRRISRYLKDTYGWDPITIERSFEELKELCKNF